MAADLRPPAPLGPGFNNGPVRPGGSPLLRPRPEREYVAGGEPYFWARNVYHALPQYIDEKTRDLGADLYERMMLDPQVASCVHILKMGILSQPVALSPAITDESDPLYPRSVEIRDFCARCLRRVKDLHCHVLYNLLDALALGNKVAEIVFDLPETGIDRGRLVLRALKVKPRRSLAFLVDPYNNLTGLLGIIPGVAPALLGGTLVGDPARLPNLLPRNKFVVFTYRPLDEDPRGQSVCNPAYDPWWMKVQMKPEYLKYLTQFAGPSLVGFTAEGAAPTQKQDEKTGELLYDEEQNILLSSPEEAMLAALLAFRNGTAAAFPHGAVVQPITMSAEGKPFIEAFGLFDSQIAKAILCQTLATEEARHQARAAAETHGDVLAMVVRHGKQCLAECIEHDLLTLLVSVNFGPESVGEGESPDMTPTASFGDVEQHDLAKMGSAIASLETAGYLTPSQRREIDVMLGLPPRTPVEVQLAAGAFHESMLPEEEEEAAPEEGAAPAPFSGTLAMEGEEFAALPGPPKTGGKPGVAGQKDFITLPGGAVIPIKRSQSGGPGKRKLGGGRTVQGPGRTRGDERRSRRRRREHALPPAQTPLLKIPEPQREPGEKRSGPKPKLPGAAGQGAEDAAAAGGEQEDKDGKAKGKAKTGSGRTRSTGGPGTKTPAPVFTPEQEAARKNFPGRVVDAELQRYVEEHCLPELAAGLGATLPGNSHPADAIIGGAEPTHGIELYVLIDDEFTSISDSGTRASEWAKTAGASFWTVVFDDREVFGAVPGEDETTPHAHEPSRRRFRLGEGAGPFELENMEEFATLGELRAAMEKGEAKGGTVSDTRRKPGAAGVDAGVDGVPRLGRERAAR